MALTAIATTSSIVFIGVLIRGLRFALAALFFAFGILLKPFVWLFTTIYGLAARIYRPALDWSLRHRLIVLTVAFGLFAGAVSLVPRLGTELIPQLAQGEFSAELRLTPGTPLVTTDEAVRRAHAAIAGRDDVALSYSVAGTGNRIDANPVDAGEHTGSLSVALVPGADRAAEAAVMDAIRRDIEGLPGLSFEFARPELLSRVHMRR